MRAQTGIAFAINDRVRAAVKRILPFHPTAAQKRVLKEIADDMAEPAPMRRLLQGDVGSGKTIVAFEAAVIAIENGYQVALMAPTEILATQHYLSARQILEAAGYRIVLLTGSQEAGRKKQVRHHIAQGQRATGDRHARADPGDGRVRQARPGHRRRAASLRRDAALPADEESRTTREPDVLVMTATPIPRTLALTLYGDLDTSVLDELPPGRTPITTRRVGDERADEVWQFVRKQVAAGHQAYVVYPVIEEGAMEGELKAAIKMHDQLRTQRVLQPARRPAARPHERRRERRDHGQLQARRDSTCWSRPRSSKSASMCPTPTSWSSSTPSASACRNCISCADASAAARPSRIAC